MHVSVVSMKLCITNHAADWVLPGVDVCGEENVVVHSSQAQSFVWKGYGLKLSIPEGCLPAGVKDCIINIKASLSGQYEFPENYHLAGAVFWLCCETVHKFKKPITVEIQHCATYDKRCAFKMDFVRATCKQELLPYNFKALGGTFSVHSSYRVVDVTSFSGIAPVIETISGSEVELSFRRYCSKLFYDSSHQSHLDIHLTVTWDDETHLTVSELVLTDFLHMFKSVYMYF